MAMVRSFVRGRVAMGMVALGVALILFGTQLHLADAASLGKPVATVKAWEIGSWWQWFWGSYGCFFDWACK